MDTESNKKPSRHEIAKLQQTFCNLCRAPDDEIKVKLDCSLCQRPFHLQCLLFKEKSMQFFKEKNNRLKFKCSQCLTCELCNEIICDPNFIECFTCSTPICGPCTEGNSKRIERLKCKVCKNNFWKREKIENIESEEDANEEETLMRSPKKKRKLKGTIKNTDKEKINCDEDKGIGKIEKLFKNCVNKYLDIKLDTEPLILPSEKILNRALKKVIDMDSTNKVSCEEDKIKIMKEISRENDYKLYIEVRKNKEEERGKEENEVISTLHFNNYIMKGLFPSKYPDDIKNEEHIYVCRFCLTPLPEEKSYVIHAKLCQWKYPPGNEIYRDEKEMISIFEVDGKRKPDYARRLCWLASLFIPHKVSTYSVWYFQFYILTRITKEGFNLIGYFSKELKPSGNNNLSCILTMPYCMGHGYGQLLIDLSYCLSIRERKIGSPEHPLSDQGLIAYRKYWKSILLCHIRKKYKEKANCISMKELSYLSGINIDDLISTALSLGLIGYNKVSESYLINVSQALDQPLKELRRKILNEKLLTWSPEEEPIGDGWSRYDC
uniref:Histone acetyltransferase n=1 Tax=Parastrongyloides trichosuri TaxID=131310 RepID=A0A0N5A1I6_PARTI